MPCSVPVQLLNVAHCSLLINYSLLSTYATLKLLSTPDSGLPKKHTLSQEPLILSSPIAVTRSFFLTPSPAAPLSNYLHFHRVRVHLAHVLATVLHLHALDHQRPCVLVAVRHRQPVIVRNHVLVDRQNCFRVRFNPGHLQWRGMGDEQEEEPHHNTARASWRKIDSWLFMSPCGKLDFNMYIYW